KVRFEGWPTHAKLADGTVCRIKGLQTYITNWDKASLDTVQDYLVSGWISASRINEKNESTRAYSMFQHQKYLSNGDFNEWKDVKYTLPSTQQVFSNETPSDEVLGGELAQNLASTNEME
ncbi:hypothetical protein, partial, partial [Parasitella parasitica]